MPVQYVRGNLSGRQVLRYDGGLAYELPDESVASADDYQPRFIARVVHLGKRNQFNGFQIRTKTSVNMTANMRRSMAVLGGAGALFSSLLNMKSSNIYKACVHACPKGQTLRSFMIPLLKDGLSQKSAQLTIASGVTIVNPWISSDTPNVPIRSAIIDKFASELSNS